MPLRSLADRHFASAPAPELSAMLLLASSLHGPRSAATTRSVRCCARSSLQPRRPMGAGRRGSCMSDLSRVRHVVLDMDGTLYKGTQLFAQTPPFLESL